MKQSLTDTICVLVGSILFSASVAWIASPSGLVTGGVSGVGIIVKALSGGIVPIFLTGIILNVPLFIISFLQRGFAFILKSTAAFLSMTLTLAFFEAIPPMISFEGDLVVSAAVYGILSGAGLGLILRSGAVSGGTDMLASIIKYKSPHLPISFIMVLIDSAVILGGVFVFGARISVYATASLFISARVIDFFVSGADNSKSVFVISDMADEIASRISSEIERGATEIEGKGFYTGNKRRIVFTVISKKELTHLRRIVSECDPRAFVTVSDTRQVLGEGFGEISLQKSSLS